MKLRLFIAYPLTSGTSKKIGWLEDEIERETKEKFPWISIKNLHLTILFLGSINYEDYLKINEIFDEVQFYPLSVKIKKIDYGPPRHKKMIWLYLEKNQDLEKIKRKFETKLDQEKIIYQREVRDYLPHINLARLKKMNNLPEIKKDLNWQVILNEIALYESKLSPQGAEYKKLKIIKAQIQKESLSEIF